MVAAIIAIHGVLGYGDFEVWPYDEVREVELTEGYGRRLNGGYRSVTRTRA